MGGLRKTGEKRARGGSSEKGVRGGKRKKMLLNISQSKKKKPGFEPGKH